MDFANHFTKIEMYIKLLAIVGFPNGFSKSLWLQMNIAPWLIPHFTALLVLCIGLFQRIHGLYSGLIHFINDVIKILVGIGYLKPYRYKLILPKIAPIPILVSVSVHHYYVFYALPTQYISTICNVFL